MTGTSRTGRWETNEVAAGEASAVAILAVDAVRLFRLLLPMYLHGRQAWEPWANLQCVGPFSQHPAKGNVEIEFGSGPMGNTFAVFRACENIEAFGGDPNQASAAQK